MIERRVHTMGTEVRVFVGPASRPGVDGPEAAAARAEAELRDFDARLSRFRPDSELSRLNADPGPSFRASPLLLEAVRAGIWGAERTGGLVDPTLLGQLRAAGYEATREGMAPVPLAEALARAPERRPAGADPAAAWRAIEVLDPPGEVRRPPGVLFDTGGTGKGLAADRVGRLLAGHDRFAVDCGGDVLVGGLDPGSEEVRVEIRDPLTGTPAEVVSVGRGAVATSGIDVHLWKDAAGGYSHHLIDPATGAPAWTGLVCAAARAPTALEADVLAKAALLGGPQRAAEFLGDHGGLVIHDDGAVERHGPLQEPPRFRLARPVAKPPRPDG